MEMDTKGMMTEMLGSLTLTLLVWGAADSGMSASTGAMAGGVTLAIMWMTFKGSEILPVLTIGNMAAGRTGWETGAMNFCMQIVGALIASGVVYWSNGSAEGSVWGGAGGLDATGAVAALLGGFLMMTVWDRLGGGWESGAFAAVLLLTGMTLSTAADLGGMLVESAWSQDNFVNVLGTMIVMGVGAAGALMFGDQFLAEEE